MQNRDRSTFVSGIMGVCSSRRRASRIEGAARWEQSCGTLSMLESVVVSECSFTIGTDPEVHVIGREFSGGGVLGLVGDIKQGWSVQDV